MNLAERHQLFLGYTAETFRSVEQRRVLENWILNGSEPSGLLHPIDWNKIEEALGGEAFCCQYCGVHLPAGDGDVCPACEADGPPCEQCGQRGHAFRDADEWGAWDEDCRYHPNRYLNDRT